VVVLFVGDLVGEEATLLLAKRLPALRAAHRIDIVIVNAENCAPSGTGMTVGLLDLLFDRGVDVVTGGNHSWDGPSAHAALSGSHVLRPLNVAPTIAGKGALTLETSGQMLTVINLADPAALSLSQVARHDVLPPYACWLEVKRCSTTIVDYHGDHVIHKQVFARAVDGEASAVLGTHTHEPTLPLYILPGGTALVTDVGMTGPAGGVQGFSYESLVAGLRSVGDCFALPLRPPVSGPISLGAVLLRIHDGLTRVVERFDWDGPIPGHRVACGKVTPVPESVGFPA
jgi:2',3'-cyclic-nucleotide 2'-phosphodiesterase